MITVNICQLKIKFSLSLILQMAASIRFWADHRLNVQVLELTKCHSYQLLMSEEESQRVAIYLLILVPLLNTTRTAHRHL